jgi:hypothetical protein
LSTSAGGALDSGAVADATDLEALLVSLSDADDHVVDECANQAVLGAVAPRVVRPTERELAVRLVDLDLARDALAQLALGALDLDEAVVDLDRHVGRERDGFESDS